MSTLDHRKPTKVFIGFEVYTQNPLTQPPNNGLSHHIFLTIYNGEDEYITLTIPGFGRTKGSPCGRMQDSFNIKEGIQNGFIQLYRSKEGDDTQISGQGIAGTETLEFDIYPGQKRDFILLPRSSSHLSSLGLQIEENYSIRLVDPPRSMTCEYTTFPDNKRDIEAFSGAAMPSCAGRHGPNTNIQVFEGSGTVQFHLMAPIHLPRLRASLQFSSNVCNLSGSPPFSLKLTTKSLVSRPICVGIAMDPWTRGCGHDLGDILDITDVETGEEVKFSSVFDLEKPIPTHDPEQFFEFCEGQVLTHEYVFKSTESNELGTLQPGRTYRAELLESGFYGFEDWHYTEANACCSGHDDPLPDEDGCIKPEFIEASPTFASFVENLIETRLTEPFIRLPRELRDQIYGYLEAEEPRVLYFRTEA